MAFQGEINWSLYAKENADLRAHLARAEKVIEAAWNLIDDRTAARVDALEEALDEYGRPSAHERDGSGNAG